MEKTGLYAVRALAHMKHTNKKGSHYKHITIDLFIELSLKQRAFVLSCSNLPRLLLLHLA